MFGLGYRSLCFGETLTQLAGLALVLIGVCVSLGLGFGVGQRIIVPPKKVGLPAGASLLVCS